MVRDLTKFQTFLGLCAGRTGQLLNLEQLGNETGISQPTAREWLSLLEASYIVFRLPPWHANISKRLVKRPKLYFYDSGVVAFLLGINDPAQVHNHPLRGALFETLVVSDIVKGFLHRGKRPPISFYRDAKGNEVDVIITTGRGDVPIEIKSSSTFSYDLTKGRPGDPQTGVGRTGRRDQSRITRRSRWIRSRHYWITRVFPALHSRQKPHKAANRRLPRVHNIR